ncbi:MAG: cysteine dioxygenase family protein [Acidobacteria bacterium]|nr:cysteine dioxygenase family protein [Acidobacteriota bacterium]
MAHPFASFIEAVDPIVRQIHEPSAVVAAIEPFLQTLVRTPDWLDARYRRAIPEKAYAQYLLYRPRDYTFSVVSFVWNPGQGSPIHDHCTWGVIGQYAGIEEETRFRKLANGSIEKAAVVSVNPGDVSHVYPPDRDIHQIMNRTTVPTISIHIYGGDIGSQPRHIYDLATRAVRPFISGYDSAAHN